MRRLFVFAFHLALFVSAAQADLVAPSTGFFGFGVPLDTIFRNDARQYQQYFHRDVFNQMALPLQVTGLQVRLPPDSQTVWPPIDVTFPSYQIVIGTASNNLITPPGGFPSGTFDPSVPFTGNMVNPVTVYNGPLTITAGSFVSGVSAPIINFNVSNYIIQPNQFLVVYISHSPNNQQPGAFTPGMATVGGSTSVGFASAVFATNTTFTTPNGVASGGAYEFNFVSGATTTNISTRGAVGVGANVMIGGFIVTGPTAKKVIIRGLGPSLTQYGVPNALANPQLLLFSGSTQIDFNDDWGTLSAADQQVLVNNNLVPGFATESALVKTLQPGAYTAQLVGANNTSGTALVEVYDVDPLSPSTLTNISTRAAVGVDSEVTIAGFIVTNANSKILIRGLGPSLTQYGVPGALADPFLELHNSTGAIIAQNNNWQTQAPGNGTPAQITATGLAPKFGKESAILLTLKPGTYTCFLKGMNNTTGVGLIEVYQIPQ